MKIKDKHYTTIWVNPHNPSVVQTIDQRLLPFKFDILNLACPDDFEMAISDMVVRGAPLIGVTAAYGIYIATLSDLTGSRRKSYLKETAEKLLASRPTAVDLKNAVDRMMKEIEEYDDPKRQSVKALEIAEKIKNESIESSKTIGKYGLELIENISKRKKGITVNILTHCNAGWLACVDYGTATAPIYMAHDKGINVHVWVDETRPRNQGSRLTAFELGEHGIPHTVIADNTGGHLMQHGMVDMVIVGTDRTTRNGDAANKIGTYLKALAAKDNNIPFYIALPSSTIDWNIFDGVKEIPIETRSENEVKYIEGWNGKQIDDLLSMPYTSKAANYGFDVTPGRLITGLITEKGICDANEKSLLQLFPEQN